MAAADTETSGAGLLASWDRSFAPPVARGSDARSRGDAGEAAVLWHAGFIANRRSLLADLGLPPVTSDGELCLRLYERCGTGAALRIAGPFTWALWDGPRRQLVGVRDRAGAHGFYYRDTAAGVSLAGRIELLLGAEPPPPNPRSVVAQIHGLAPPAGETFYEGIRALEPGEQIVVTRAGAQVTRYWQLDLLPELRLGGDEEYAGALRDVMREVIAEYLPRERAGVTLSSGLDSTLVAAAMREADPTAGITAVTWVTPELPEADESAAAAQAARRLDMPQITVAADQFWPLRTSDEPRTEAGSPACGCYGELWDATWRAAARAGCRTLFTGTGGDHLFGGDVFAYADLLLTGRWRSLCGQLREHIPHSPMRPAGVVARMLLAPVLRAYIPGLRRPAADPVPWLKAAHRPLYRECALPPALPAGLLLPGRRQRHELLRDRRLPRTLEAAGAGAARYGVELRHPLLDHRLVEFASRLPAGQTFRAARRKTVVRNVLRGALPDEIVEARAKTYLTAVALRGLAERERRKVRALMTDMRAEDAGYVDAALLRRSYDRFLSRGERSTPFWHTLALEAWLRQQF